MNERTSSAFLFGTVVLLIAGALAMSPANVSAADPRPALVRDIDNSDRANQVAGSRWIELGPGVSANDECIIVPVGKRLIIEQISMMMWVPTGQTAHAYVWVQGTPGGYHGIPVQREGAASATEDLFVVNQPFRHRVTPPETFCLGVQRYPSAGSARAGFNFGGYYIDTP